MGKVVSFVDNIAKFRGEEARHSMTMRKMNQWYFKNRQKMQEAAEKRKRPKSMQDCLADQ